ncbi:MAG: fused MFS/spermidine synthase [Magnetococcales bacterium]|nr:fused MFS/spermidine synthase [Magnetococcales bacterium]
MKSPDFSPQRQNSSTDSLTASSLPPVKILHRRFWQGRTVDVVEEASGNRALYFMSRFIQSRMDPADPIRLVLPYSRHIMASLLFLEETAPPNVLMIGLGGGSLAKFLLHHFPEAHLDVVEIDEGMEVLARTFFALPDDPRLRIHVADGWEYLQRDIKETYDLILVDAFDRDGMARTVYVRQFFQAARKLTTPTGIVAVNLAKSDSLVYNTSAKLLKGLCADSLYRLPVRTSRNEILMCSNAPIPPLDWKRMENRAQTLGQRIPLEFGQFLQDIRRFSSPFWSRGIHW